MNDKEKIELALSKLTIEEQELLGLIKKPKTPRTKKNHKLKIFYMIGDADGNTNKEAVISINNPFLKPLTIKELKKLLVDLEQERANIDELEIWIQPAGTPSVEVYSMGIVNVSSNNTEQQGKEVFGIYLEGDCF